MSEIGMDRETMELAAPAPALSDRGREHLEAPSYPARRAARRTGRIIRDRPARACGAGTIDGPRMRLWPEIKVMLGF